VDNDLERKIEEINIRLRLGKLDSLFLFAPTLLGIAFAFSQYYLRMVTEEIMSVFIPILIIVVGLPVYVGYYRGGILDSIVERARGWIHLVNGFIVYLFLVVQLPLINAISVYVPLTLPMNSIYGILIGLVNFPLAQRVGSKILSLADRRTSKKYEDVRHTFFLTSLSAYSIATFIFLLISFSSAISKLGKQVPEGFYVRFMDLSYSPSTINEWMFLAYERFSIILLTSLFLVFIVTEAYAASEMSLENLIALLSLGLFLQPILFVISLIDMQFSNFLFILSIISETAFVALALMSLKRLAKINR